uniref:Uncharacterized protein n=1 Tax=Timema bartmani TaxID=61472 RepID=A0A7R9I0K8_9NEOP|nr:unnamed protein product [Timema bartmani]
MLDWSCRASGPSTDPSDGCSQFRKDPAANYKKDLFLVSCKSIGGDIVGSKWSELSGRTPPQVMGRGMPAPARAFTDLGTIRSRARWDTQRGRVPGGSKDPGPSRQQELTIPGPSREQEPTIRGPSREQELTIQGPFRRARAYRPRAFKRGIQESKILPSKSLPFEGHQENKSLPRKGLQEIKSLRPRAFKKVRAYHTRAVKRTRYYRPRAFNRLRAYHTRAIKRARGYRPRAFKRSKTYRPRAIKRARAFKKARE